MIIRLLFSTLAILLLAGCLSYPEGQEYADLYEWSDTRFSGKPTDNELLTGCKRYSNKNNNPGQIIGCQDTEVYDIRNTELRDFTKRKLGEQSCVPSVKAEGARFYVKTNRHFFFLDKQLRTFWYVPKDYYSDGMSIPDWLLAILPGPIWNPATPKTLPAALVHDRYLCLREGTAKNPDVAVYRQQSCTHTAFENGLKTSGTSNTIGAVMVTAVSLVNRERDGYCPRQQYDDVAEIEQNLAIALPDLKDLRSEIEDECFDQEPTLLCFSNMDNLKHLAQRPRDGKVPDTWRELFGRLYCLERAAIVPGTADGGFISFAERAYCKDNYRIDFSAAAQSPFRAGDLWIESSGLLARPEEYAPRMPGPEAMLDMIAKASTMDQAIDLLTKWNKEHPRNPDNELVFGL